MKSTAIALIVSSTVAIAAAGGVYAQPNTPPSSGSTGTGGLGTPMSTPASPGGNTTTSGETKRVQTKTQATDPKPLERPPTTTPGQDKPR
jgi:hypothetical protein